jgi:hypothetical protein
MAQTHTESPSLKRWIIWSVLGIPIGLLDFYAVFHLALRIPVADLWEPFGVVSVLSLLFGPSMYWAQKSNVRRRDHRKRVISLAGSYLWLGALVCFYYGVKDGYLAAADTLPLFVIITAMIVIGCLVAVYACKKREHEVSEASESESSETREGGRGVQ